MKIFLKTFKTQGNLPKVKKKNDFQQSYLKINTYSMNSPIELVVIRRQSNQEFCEGFPQYYD